MYKNTGKFNTDGVGCILRFNRTTERVLMIGIIIMTLVLLNCGICVTLFTISQWRNSARLTDAQVEVQNALRDNVGKPQIIEQRYYSPQDL